MVDTLAEVMVQIISGFLSLDITGRGYTFFVWIWIAWVFAAVGWVLQMFYRGDLND